MSSEKQYENAPADIAEAIEQAEVVADFLPPPETTRSTGKSRTFTPRNSGSAGDAAGTVTPHARPTVHPVLSHRRHPADSRMAGVGRRAASLRRVRRRCGGAVSWRSGATTAPTKRSPSRELIRPVLALLGWVHALPQQGAARGEDIPDYLLFARRGIQGARRRAQRLRSPLPGRPADPRKQALRSAPR